MFLIAGIAPKTKVLDQNPRPCPVCGRVRAYYRRVDQYLSLFFIPVLRVKTGEPFLLCEPCEKTVSEMKADYRTETDRTRHRCRKCGRGLGEGFRFCPFCGTPIP
jgi:ribosomal protein S14